MRSITVLNQPSATKAKAAPCYFFELLVAVVTKATKRTWVEETVERFHNANLGWIFLCNIASFERLQLSTCLSLDLFGTLETLLLFASLLIQSGLFLLLLA